MSRSNACSPGPGDSSSQSGRRTGRWKLYHRRNLFRLGYPKSGDFFNNCMAWSRAKLGLARLSGKDAELWKRAGWDQEETLPERTKPMRRFTITLAILALASDT